MTFADKDPDPDQVNQSVTTYDVKLSFVARLWRWWRNR